MMVLLETCTLNYCTATSTVRSTIVQKHDIQLLYEP